MGLRLIVVAVLLILAATPVGAAEALSHADEIELFAKTMAVAKTVKEGCPGLEVNDRLLDALRQRLGLVEADHPAFAPKAREAAEVLRRALDEAPSRQAWCASALRLYGPDGKLMHGLIRRPKSGTE